MPDLASFKLDLEAATEEAVATAPPAPAAKVTTAAARSNGAAAPN
jgi:hypothetical protein